MRASCSHEDAFFPVDLADLPGRANLITSHHFFQVRHHRNCSTFKLKLRLVPHGKRDIDKDSLRSDSSTAQFPVIRTLISIAATMHWRLGSIDIKNAYLQAGPPHRDIYVKPAAGWCDRRQVWKLTKPAYELVDSGRLWQLRR